MLTGRDSWQTAPRPRWTLNIALDDVVGVNVGPPREMGLRNHTNVKADRGKCAAVWPDRPVRSRLCGHRGRDPGRSGSALPVTRAPATPNREVATANRPRDGELDRVSHICDVAGGN